MEREPLPCGGAKCWRTLTASQHDPATCPTYREPERHACGHPVTPTNPKIPSAAGDWCAECARLAEDPREAS